MKASEHPRWALAGVALTVVAALAVAVAAGRVARDRGALGCGYQPREHVTNWHLGASRPGRVRARVGEGVLLVSPDGRPLRHVMVQGTAGLSPGTQNGLRDYVFAVTRSGSATVVATTMAGTRVTGTLRSHC